LKFFNDFSRENHGHGGHEHGVHGGVFGGELSFKRMSADTSSYIFLTEMPLYFARKPPFLGFDDQS
jgi:hypothetical protein